MITINAFLDGVLDDFIKYVESHEKLCKLLDTHFDAGRIPDYSDRNIQQLYLLRYAYAYAFEYKVMYTQLFSRIGIAPKIKVTSIGCGNLLDYWALARVVKKECDIIYCGIDTFDWLYQIPPRNRDDVQCALGDAVSLFQEAPNFSSDIYIFPKSISEFSDDSVRMLANCFTKDNISKDTVHFMFSLRTDENSLERDKNKTKIFYNRLMGCGFHTNDDSSKHWVFSDSIKEKPIREVDDDFQHPNEVVDYLKNLYARCSIFSACPDSSECQERLGRWPILRCKYMACQIFTFER